MLYFSNAVLRVWTKMGEDSIRYMTWGCFRNRRQTITISLYTLNISPQWSTCMLFCVQTATWKESISCGTGLASVTIFCSLWPIWVLMALLRSTKRWKQRLWTWQDTSFWTVSPSMTGMMKSKSGVTSGISCRSLNRTRLSLDGQNQSM